MSIVQWLLLILVIVVVAGAYWYLRNQSSTDPWQGMDDEGVDDATARGESLGGDSYIVGVRNLSADDPAARKPAAPDRHTGGPDYKSGDDELSDAAAERSWAAYKKPSSAQQAGGDTIISRATRPKPVAAGEPSDARERAAHAQPADPAYTRPDAARPEPPARAPSQPAPAREAAAERPARRAPEAPASDPPAWLDRGDTPAPAASAEPVQPAPDSATEPAPASQPEPSPSSAPESAPAAPAGQRIDNMRPQRVPPGEQSVFVLHVTSVDGGFFRGADIHAALKEEDLKFGLNDIYHRVTETHGVPESVFAVADMLKPGRLDPAQQDRLATPGLTMFLVVPGPIEGVPAMRDMMVTANALARALGGEVLDDKRARLKAQTAQYMLDQIAELDRQARITSLR